MNRSRHTPAAALCVLCLAALCVAPRPARATMPPRSGALPPAVIDAFKAGTFDIPQPVARVSRGIHPELVKQSQTVWILPVILVSFADDTLTYAGPTFEHELFDTTGTTPTGSVYDYYQWVSGGLLSVTGRVVATVRLPEPRAYYGGSSGGLRGQTPNNDLGLVRDALRICSNSVNWAPYDLNHDGAVDMVWFIHAGIGGEATPDPTYLWSVTSRMSGGWTQPGVWTTETAYTTTAGISTYMVVDRFTILPELSPFVTGAPSEIGVFCHEFGHCLGLPDLYDTSSGGVGNTGPGFWGLMSMGGWGGNGSSPQYPVHLCAWSMRYLGWDHSFQPDQDTTVTLTPLEDTHKVVDWWFQGEMSSEHFLIENRQRVGFDRNLPNDGLIVYHVDEAVMSYGLAGNRVNAGLSPGLQVVEADGDYDMFLGRNRGDANDPFPGAKNVVRLDDWTTPNTRTFFFNQRTDIALDQITQVGQDVRMRVHVRSPGWLDPENQSGPGFAPTNLVGPGRNAAVDADGDFWYVASEIVDGRPQIVLHDGRGNLASTEQVSQSTGQAYDPVLAEIPGGNLAVVWCDTRDGRPMLYYRSRLFGFWSVERRLTLLPGDCTSPSMISDDTGTLTVAFNYTASDRSQVRLLRFTYFSPFGQSIPVTDFFDFETAPSVFPTPTGSSMVTWIDKLAYRPRLMFARFSPDSGVSQPQPLTSPPNRQQTALTGVMDAAGNLHFAWLCIGPAVSEIHYQFRPASPDTLGIGDLLLESRGEPMAGIVLGAGADLSIHLVFEATRSGITQIRYRRMSPGEGWDLNSTEISLPSDGTAKRPVVFPRPEGDVSVGYTLYPVTGDPQLMIRHRVLNGTPESPTTSVPFASSSGIHIGPNPLRAGGVLRIEWSGVVASPPGPVEVFDIAGRRVASLPWSSSGTGWSARADGALTRSWATGVYFARTGATGASTRIVVIR